ncbi:MAG TPA: acyltransferase [Verrucomicrobiae bacterium]|nr:acyltransferase [Verrucomicrobiae bacterium]
MSQSPAGGAPVSRHPALDYLRAFVTLLVIAHHAVLAYHPQMPKRVESFTAPPFLWAAFPVLDPQRAPGVDLFVGFNDIFFMSLMFFLSGIFTWPSLSRKGPGTFFRDRALRLGIPFVVSALVLAPVAYFPAFLAITGNHSFSDYLRQWVGLGFWPAGPAWFIWVLLAFGGIVATLCHLAPNSGIALANLVAGADQMPGRFFGKLLLASAIVYLPLAMVIDPSRWFSFGPFTVQGCRLPLYLLYYLTGAAVGAAGVDRGLLAPEGKLARHWLRWQFLAFSAFIATIICFIMLMGVLTKGGAAPGLRLATNFSFVVSCAASSLMCLAFFLRFAQRHHCLLDSLSRNAYGMYLVHYCFVNWLQYALLPSSMPGIAKALIVFVGGTLLSWGTTAVLRKIPAVGRVI